MLHLQHTPAVHCAQPKANAQVMTLSSSVSSPYYGSGQSNHPTDPTVTVRRECSEHQQSLAWAVV